MLASCLCLCTFLFACAEIPTSTRGPPPSFLPSSGRHPRSEVGVLVASWHTGIVLPRDELGPLGSLLQDPQAKYLSFGWGNRRFYMATHPGSGDAMAALFRSPSALFVQEVATPADLSVGDARIHWLCADRDELWRVVDYIEASLSRPRGEPVDLGPGPLPRSHFYGSVAHYSAVHTCNTWTIAALQYAGLPVQASGVILASQVRRRIQELRACPPP